MSSTKEVFVIDTSVAIKWFLKEPYESEALKLKNAFKNGLCRLLTTDLIYPEFANTIWKRVIFYDLEPEDGVLMINAFRTIPLEVISSKELLAKAFTIATQYKRSVYDALFLALSVENTCNLVTADEKFYNALRNSFPKLLWIGNTVFPVK